MRQFLTGLLILVLFVPISHVGYASDVSETEKAIEFDFNVDDYSTSSNQIIAQVDTSTFDKPDRIENVLDNIDNYSPVEEDSIGSVDDAIDKSIAWYKRLPNKGDPWTVWFLWILGGLGLLLGIFRYAYVKFFKRE